MNRTVIATKQSLADLLRRNSKVLLAFFIPSTILMISFLLRGVFPVGPRNVLTIDLYHQYAPFLAELRDRYRTLSSLFYTWSGGLGVNFWSLFAYYLASPLNLLTVLFPPSYLTEAILLLILIKIGLCGSFFFRFLRGVWKNNNYLMVALSSMYALSAFNLAYYWDIMWLDGIALLPLTLLGLVRLVREGKGMLYAVTLGLIIFCNYYIAFFICIFTLLYFLVLLFERTDPSHPRRFFTTVGQFILYSGLGAGTSAVLAIPTYLSLRLTSAAGNTMPSPVTHYFELFDYIGQHFTLTPPTIRDGMPNMYAGAVLLILIPMYFFARSVPLRSKVLHLALLALMIISFNINTLNFIWHGFHFPNQLPYRNSFLYVFLVLSMGYPALRALREFTGKQIGAFAGTAMLLVLLAQKINTKKPELQTLYVTLIFLAIYAAVLTIDRIRRFSRRDWAMAVLIIVTAELFLNTMLTVHKIDKTESLSWRDGYLAGREVNQIREELHKLRQADPEFYRVETLPPRTTNDGFMYQYNGISIFSSTMPTKPVRLFENLGYHSNSINSFKYEASTLPLDSLLDVRYLIRRSGNADWRLYQKVSETDELEVFRNPRAVGIGFVGLPGFAEWSSSFSDPLNTQSQMFEALTGEPSFYVPITQEAANHVNLTINSGSQRYYSYRRTNKDSDSTARIRITNPVDQHVYLFSRVAANDPDSGFVQLESTRKIDFNATRSTIIDVGFVPADQVIEFSLHFPAKSPETGSFDLYAYGLDTQILDRHLDILRQGSLRITRFSDTHIAGEVDAREDGQFVLTIPYDQGWRAKVDGVAVETVAVDNALISFPLSAGHHQITLDYRPQGIEIGLLISLLSVAGLLLLGLVILPRLQRRRKRLLHGRIPPGWPALTGDARLPGNRRKRSSRDHQALVRRPIEYDKLMLENRREERQMAGGTEMEPNKDVNAQVKAIEFYYCSICGNLVAMIQNGGGELVCCGEPMSLIEPDTVDASQEKHVPVVRREADKATVTVGSVLHPMEEKHYITWIAIAQASRWQIKYLKPGDKPEAVFTVCDGPLVAYEYCNLHGLWKKEA